MEALRRKNTFVPKEGDAPISLRSGTGQALVEMALLLPIFLLLLLGAAEFGRLAYAAIEVSNAARAGVAYGSQDHVKASDGPGIVAAALADASNVASMSVSGVSNFCVCSTGGSVVCTNALASCASPARVIEYVQVNTAANVTPIVHIPGLPGTFTLHGQAIMRVLQ